MAEKETPRVAVDRQNLERRLIQQRQAYTHLLRGAEQLLRLGAIFWTERWLLRLVRYLYRRRLEQLSATETQFMHTGHLKENMLEAAVEAALQGHELGEWEQVDDTGHEWEARCRVCGRTTFVSETVRYSVLGEICSDKIAPKSSPWE